MGEQQTHTLIAKVAEVEFDLVSEGPGPAVFADTMSIRCRTQDGVELTLSHIPDARVNSQTSVVFTYSIETPALADLEVES